MFILIIMSYDEIIGIIWPVGGYYFVPSFDGVVSCTCFAFLNKSLCVIVVFHCALYHFILIVPEDLFLVILGSGLIWFREWMEF